MILRAAVTILAVLFGAALMSTKPAAATTISGLIEFSTDSNGNTSGQGWNTVGGDGVFNLYVASGPISASPTFLNSGNSSSTSISIPLPAGTHTFSIYADSEPTLSHYGLNLFFNGNNSTPGISVFAALRTSSTQPSFAANGGLTRTEAFGFVPGANTLTFADGPITVTLTDYFFSSPSQLGFDVVSPFNNIPDGFNDFGGQFTVTVTPEPGTLLLLGSGLAVLGALRKRYRHT
jgi:PEP-CTERM motif-containing protein